ncbi:MFS sugar transporter, putative [Talaromyces stipitatus ATCC 10500]|uniref:MFS sugar transporter, putative n=1 Tax=Talaromyces stipitatus (strain ATCC 10500 / CBS 375.48 / QM 6759 / NRRL 1006) TaxID=441959 RepID=B8M6T6_TALSN|nr:MFS sugar transporter, putative [Talaromyces stipitatus ATCC 10500]XP_002480592.1 MFS sugar transporter, putative [Talaromyces stipitatus ATCC 10500]EED20156.1 MFS sugar transporter, putative [Talaromyces stipitatus ATCC 10500]EED20158.1 MFS sugar transporter, putative [Talaromyces stipitatus ATCC 10500]
MAESEKVVQTDKVVREDNSVRSELAENVKTESSGILDAENLHNRPADNLNVVFENPLANVPREKLLKDVEDFCQKFNLMEHVDDFRKGALVSQNPAAAMDLTELTDEERNILLREHTHKWHQPWELYWLVIMCSLAAAVQGMDETVNNGAQAIYLKNLGIESKFSGKQLNDITGLIVGAPYLCCAIIGCWLTEPMNRFFARRGTIFISCFFAAVCSIWEGVANSWVNLFIARFFLGLGIGPKSSTVPIYAAECSPAPIRGALVMMWQMWTAFGIMLGNIMGVAFMSLSDDLSWRLMLGSTVVLPVIVCTQVYFCPESPRWLIQHGQVEKAFRSFRKLRSHDIQAARDLYYAYVLVQLEREINKGKNFFTMFMELFTIGRNRRATIGSWIVMFMQQFCGVNVIAYYSTTIFTSSGYSIQSALLASMGTGILNWVFALPATLTIDTFGRRNLLLTTFPFLAICLLWTGFSFWIEPDIPDSKKRVAMVTTGMYLFEVFYSPGEGPVPFTYSAEAFPLHVREVGMSWATATCWCFNFILSFTWPSLLTSFKPQGAFGWYAAWCIIGWFLVLFFLPETKALTLEELDQVFSVPTWKHASYQLKNAIWHVRTWVFRQKLEPLPPFYQGIEKLNES